jgi:diadenosine tetraphosphate (Ap4A) HIT family hydrolase
MSINKLLPRSEYDQHLMALKGQCTFCKMSDDLNIKKYQHWTFVYAAFPYRKYHTLLISKRHIIQFSDLVPEELAELSSITQEIIQIYRKSGVVAEDSEFGDQVLFSWRSRSGTAVEKKPVFHLHFHIYPEVGKDVAIVLDDRAWDIDMSRLS